MKKTLLFAAVVVALAAAAGIWFAVYADYSEGYRVGKVIKLSHKVERAS